MLNRSRKVACPECNGSNFWKGDPKPTDELNCRFCDAFITTYDGHIYDSVRHEAAQTLAKFIESDSEHDLAKLKHALSHPEHRVARSG